MEIGRGIYHVRFVEVSLFVGIMMMKRLFIMLWMAGNNAD